MWVWHIVMLSRLLGVLVDLGSRISDQFYHAAWLLDTCLLVCLPGGDWVVQPLGHDALSVVHPPSHALVASFFCVPACLCVCV